MKTPITPEALIEMQECPDCKGSGAIIIERIQQICCMNFDRTGGCCNYPITERVQDQEQCCMCFATGYIPTPPQ